MKPIMPLTETMAPIINDRFNLSDNYSMIQKLALVIVLSIFGWMGTARLIRGEVITLPPAEVERLMQLAADPSTCTMTK